MREVPDGECACQRIYFREQIGEGRQSGVQASAGELKQQDGWVKSIQYKIASSSRRMGRRFRYGPESRV